MKRVFILAAGNITLFLGILGVFLPVLPTTPFLLLSAGCYMKSSPKLYNWLINHKVLGLYIRSYIKYKAISVKGKIISIAALWIVISSSVIFFTSSPHLRIALIVIAVGVTIFLIQIKTLTKQQLKDTPEI